MTPTRRWGHRAAWQSCPPGPQGRRGASREAGGSHCPQWAAPAPECRGSRARWRDFDLNETENSKKIASEKFLNSLTIWIITGLAERKEYLLKPLFVVAPTLRFEHHGSLSAYIKKINREGTSVNQKLTIGNQETVNSVVNLAAISTSLVEITDKFLGSTAILRIL